MNIIKHDGGKIAPLLLKQTHNKNVLDKNRTILTCNAQRIEILCDAKFIDFCPICGEIIID